MFAKSNQIDEKLIKLAYDSRKSYSKYCNNKTNDNDKVGDILEETSELEELALTSKINKPNILICANAKHS